MAFVKSRLPGSQRYYGWRAQAPDRRDLRFLPARKVLETLPPKVDLSPKMGPVLDQGDLGSCGPNSVASLILFDQQAQALPVKVPSRLLIYWFTRELMGTLGDDSGVDNRTMLKSLNQSGFTVEELWPYDVSKFRVQPPAAAVTAARGAKITNYAVVEQSLDIMRGTLASGFPFLYGFTVYESFESDTVANTGRVPLPGPGERVVAGHDVVICGYDDGQQMFLFKNSWDGWGFNRGGYGWMPYAYATDGNLASDFWVINAIPGTSPGPTPPPAPPPAPPKVVFPLNFTEAVPRGGRIVLFAPVRIPAGRYDVVSHQGASERAAGGEGEEYRVEAWDPGQVDAEQLKGYDEQGHKVQREEFSSMPQESQKPPPAAPERAQAPSNPVPELPPEVQQQIPQGQARLSRETGQALTQMEPARLGPHVTTLLAELAAAVQVLLQHLAAQREEQKSQQGA